MGLEQYEQTFLLNFAKGGGSLLSRRHLSRLRLQDLPKMNITDFGHQKRLMAHVRQVDGLLLGDRDIGAGAAARLPQPRETQGDSLPW